jgi:hypothetical protein
MAREDADTVLDLYKLAVEMADRVSSRRAAANTYFLTLNTTLAAVVGVASSAQSSSHGSVPARNAFGLVLTATAGIVLAVAWRALLSYYRRLNAAKFVVINTLERQLPVRPYTDEWAILRPLPQDVERGQALAWWKLRERGRRWWSHTKQTDAAVVEQTVPTVFIVIYLALAVRALVT